MKDDDASASETENAVGDASHLRLSAEDQLALAEMILNPPAPSLSLIWAAQRYRAMFGLDGPPMHHPSRSDS